MKSKFVLALFLIYSINLISDDVLDETVYWELTRVDTKIEEKKFDEAEKSLNDAFKINKSDIFSLFVLGKLKREQNKLEEAILIFKNLDISLLIE